MRVLLCIFLALTVVSFSLSSQTSRPIPPGIREADKLPGPADVPPLNQPSFVHADPKMMRDQARELSQLAQSVPADVSQFTNGTLPKDMSEKLKRIEKLSKTLRGELSR